VKGKKNIEAPRGPAFGQPPAPPGPQVVRGAARYTFDVARKACAHQDDAFAASARPTIIAIESARRQRPGVTRLLTFEDARTGLSDRPRGRVGLEDPDRHRVLDNVVRFIGERSPAVVAETEAAAKKVPPALANMKSCTG